MKDTLVSIVIPIYNVERYLDRCMNSIFNQTYKNLEIILVDDGSPDNCPNMCDAWAKKDKRIKVVHKKNAGLGMARNTGIENATGDYICFFDSDDYVELNTIELGLKSAEKYNSDIIMWGLKQFNSKNEIIFEQFPSLSKEYYSNDEILDYILPNVLSFDPETGKKQGLNMSAWGSMYSMNLINRISFRFVSEREYISEDFYSLLKLYKDVNRFSIVKKPLYNYFVNDQSLTHVYDPNRFNRISYCFKGMLDICNQFNYSKEISNGVNSLYIGSVIGALKLIISSENTKQEQIQYIENVLNDEYLNECLCKINLKTESLLRKFFIYFMKRKSSKKIYGILKLKS